MKIVNRFFFFLILIMLGSLICIVSYFSELNLTTNKSVQKELSLQNFLSLPSFLNNSIEQIDNEFYFKNYSKKCHQRDNIFSKGNGLDVCPCFPQTLKGYFSEPQYQNTQISNGGTWKPKTCTSRWTVAIIVPFRNRETHVNLLAEHLHQFLPRQQIQYGIFIIEQMYPELFNRATLLNIGILQVLKITEPKYDCFFLHDVDMIMIDDRAMYSCDFAPLHLGGFRNSSNFRNINEYFFGALTVLTRTQVIKSNGLSNKFFGWGGEDEDHFHRMLVMLPEATLYRYPKSISRAVMSVHVAVKEHGNEYSKYRYEGSSFYRANHYKADGLNTVNYTVLKKEETNLFTRFKIRIEKNVQIHSPCMEKKVNCWDLKMLQKGLTDCCVTDEGPSCCHIPAYPVVGERRQFHSLA